MAQGQIGKDALSLLSVKWCVQMTDLEEISEAPLGGMDASKG